VATIKPLTKASRRIISGASIPTVVREAFRLAQDERPGPVHLLIEWPEDVAGEQVSDDLAVIPLHPIELPVAHEAAIERASAMLRSAERPLVMFGAASNRPRLVGQLTDFIRRTGIPFFINRMRMKLGEALFSRHAAAHVFETHAEAIEFLHRP
jgi:acetolactate synthase I/II/III large subunit